MNAKNVSVAPAINNGIVTARKQSLWSKLKRDKFLYLLALPGIIYFIVFKYVPIWGIIIAFQDYFPLDGVMGSPWVGLENFRRFFSHDDFFLLLRNTLAISMLNLFFYFPIPILLSLMLNEVVQPRLKKLVQTIVYLPHFLSWVIIYGITFLMFSQSEGVVNKVLTFLGFGTFDFLTNPKMFWIMITGQTIWKEAGWGTVIFLAAIAGIDPSLYEAAKIDGAGKMKQMWHVTLPGIRTTIIVLLIMRMGSIIDVSFDQIYLMMNGAVSSVADVFDTYVYRVGVGQGEFSYSTAIGLFKTIVGLTLILITNRIAKSFGEEGVV